MKKLFVILVALLCCSATVFAQNKGDKYIGGNLGLAIQTASSNYGDSAAAAGVAITPEFGIFVADNAKLGVSLGYELTAGTHTIKLAPNFAYYVRLCDGLYYMPVLKLGFAMAAAEGIVIPGVVCGMDLFSLEFRPSQHFGFSANLLSFDFTALGKSGFTASAVNFSLGVNPTVAFKYYF